MDRFEKLSAKLESGEITDRELDELEEMISSSYEARDRFLDHSQIAGLLYAAGNSDAESEGKVVAISSGPEEKQSVRRFLPGIAVAAMAGALVLGIGIFKSESIEKPGGGILAANHTKPSLTAAQRYDRVLKKGTGGASQSHPESASIGSGSNPGDDIIFNRDIRPVLSDNCVFCHGPDAAERKADLRLDTEEGAMAAIVRGDAANSELIARIFHHDTDELMPPPESSRSLSDIEKDLLKRWVESGAPWQKHWAFEPVVKPEGSGIDEFIGKRLKEKQLEFSPPAEKETLIRRVTLDLTGLPPTMAEVDDFLRDSSPRAFEKVVDRLLQSPRYAERMTWQWLEAARYADTDGYQNDGPRDMWRWRDWVIHAYSQNMPFDQFTIEQLAGDLLPKPTLEQRIATGFNRNHRYNSESGLVLEEFLLENAVDRVDTTSTVWMGVTMGCARCHDHKYDPFSQKEYYQLISFFDAVPESGRAIKFGNSEPWIKAPTDEQLQRLAALERDIQSAEEALAKQEPNIKMAATAIEDSGAAADKPVVSSGLNHHFGVDKPVVADGSKPVLISKEKIPGLICNGRFSVAFQMTPGQVDKGAVLSNESADTTRKGIFVSFRNGHLRFSIVSRWIAGVAMLETVDSFLPGKPVHITLTNDATQRVSGMKIYIDGKPAKAREIYNTNSNAGGKNHGGPMNVGGSKHIGMWKGEVRDLRFYTDRTLEPEDASIIARGFDARRFVLEHGEPAVTKAWQRLEKARRARLSYYDSIQTAMVMVEAPKTEPTLLRVRGEYHNHGEPVSSGVPEVLSAFPEDVPANRLGFAKWLVSGNHPLTARVTVNRYWQMLFGTGLVKTAEDFGTQGSLPTHPELLDWLAAEFVESGWDTRSILKKIVMSRTYRQSSRITSELRERDPDNLWLARAPRLKLPGNVLRDQALFSSGLLVEKTGGPSVKPYQPARLWAEASNVRYQVGKGEDLYRRSLYTYWKRTLAPPSMAVLDTADREWCSVKPKRTNTPLQALTLLNETAFFEAARNLGEEILTDGGSLVEDKVNFAFKKILSRSPSPREKEILISGWGKYIEECSKDPALISQIQSVGESKMKRDLDPVQLGAATALANVIYNLEETTVRE
ncbi:MAG: DUF1553 domain-containing protein [Verrucomicrobiales bacterium]|nr:DUF1553 domain-containing protein [Verrucomicrobiales bacterium]